MADSSPSGSPANGSADRTTETDTDRRIAAAMELYLAEWEAGRVPDRQQFLQQHAEIADALEDHLQGLEFICQAGPRLADSFDSASSSIAAPIRPLATLGDFRIVREIGRGGMGVVYQAEQLSLGRTVALKILPFAAMLDEKQRKRFQTEARAAASLEHPNIIPVYYVGNERGVAYYAMQLIRGTTVADVIEQLRQERAAGGAAGRSDSLGRLTGRFGRDRADSATRPDTADKSHDRRGSDAPSDATKAPVLAAEPSAGGQPQPTGKTSITATSSSGRHAFARTVARLGIQAAEGLQHAHEQGIIHRDIKPGNLMLDWNGKLYVMDFGLARIEADPGTTMTGTVLGTLRYMAPEQALGQRGAVDHHADIYSLGATLYELLTLRHAVDGDDRRTLLKRIATDEPRSPRKFDRSIPVPLETIVLKAMAKEPGSRYHSAQDLADDLRRFIDHKPIKAKPTSWLEHTAKWSIRHQPIVWSSLVVLLLATIGLAISTAIVTRQKRATINALTRAEENRIRAESNRRRAQQAVDFSQKLLYVRNLSLAAHAWRAGDATRAAAVLRSNPAFSQRPDLRGFEWYFLRRRVMPDHVIVTAQKEEVGTVCYAPDGSEFATAGEDRLIHLWDAATFTERVSLRGHSKSVEQVAYHPDGATLVSCADDGTVRFWDVATGRPRAVLKRPHDGANVYGVAFSHDGLRLATVGGDNQVRLWTAAGQPDGLLVGHRRDVRAVVFSPDDTLLATAGYDRTVRIWDMQTKRHLRTLKGHMGMVFAVAFSPDGQYVASGGNDRTIRYWRPRTGHCELVIHGHHDSLQSIAFMPEGDRIVAGDRGGSIRIWHTTRRVLDQYALEDDAEHFAATALAPNGHEWAALSSDGRLLVRDITFDRTRVLAEDFPPTQRFRALTISSDGQTLICGLRVFVKAPDRQLGWREETANSGPTPSTLALTRDGQMLAMAWGGNISLCDAKTRTEIRSFTTSRDNILSVCFSPDARLLATASDDGHVELWDVSSGTRHANLPGHTDLVWNVAFSKSGRYVASSGADGTIRVWDMRSQQGVATFQAQRMERFDFSPDEQSLVCALANGTVREWSLADGADRGEVFQNDLKTSYDRRFWNVQFSASGNELLCGSGCRSVFVLDMTRLTASGDPSDTLQGHEGRVWSIAVASNGQQIVSASRDGTVRSWSPGQQRWSWLVGHRDDQSAVNDVAFTPDGKGLLIARVYQALLRRLPHGATAAHLTSPPRPGFGRQISALALVDNIVAMGLRAGVVVLWDLGQQATLRQITAFPEIDDEIDAIALSPDGTTLAAATRWGSQLGLWDVATGQQQEKFEALDCDSLAFSPNGELLAYCDGHDVVLWNMRTRTEVRRLAAHSLTVHALAFAPDGSALATVGEDRKVKFWDTTTWKARWERSGHAAPILSIAYSPDGRTLATGAADGSINLWNVETGEPVFQLARAATSVVKLVFSPTQDRLLGVLESGRIVLFEGGQAPLSSKD